MTRPASARARLRVTLSHLMCFVFGCKLTRDADSGDPRCVRCGEFFDYSGVSNFLAWAWLYRRWYLWLAPATLAVLVFWVYGHIDNNIYQHWKTTGSLTK